MARKRTKRMVANDHVVVTSKNYGNTLKGTKIYFEGKRPKGLKPDGSINMGKHVLEALTPRFERFRWIITPDKDSINDEYGITRVRTSLKLLAKMNDELRERTRDIKHDIVRKTFSKKFPDNFTTTTSPAYVPGTIARILSADIITRLSTEDRDTLNNFLPEYISTESVGTATLLNATTQIKTLRQLVDELRNEINANRTEHWWQDYIKKNILLIQQGYIKPLEKLNVAIGTTKLPDFMLVTHDNYLDILEIKRPQTAILKHDMSRNNYYFDTEISKAISQTENYIHNVSSQADSIRSYLKDHEHLEIKAVRPRGIILAGNTMTFTEQKQRDDLRLLSQGIKNITVLTYDELLARVQNYIEVLETFSKPITTPARPRQRRIRS
jgi:bisphosphoglycerate-dependent phosphoglycerate mutase